ncbi:MAG: PQQ-binding-like beta-propeller repeat protein [Acidobacteriota bacterium]|nr:PQQ-binding-like beta-propeller repeat protein [Acidobacteriota bacterium]MDE3265164.1 PQQ-binding-like beta-propeller repeat protein [Acidobacteriota bacterium]
MKTRISLSLRLALVTLIAAAAVAAANEPPAMFGNTPARNMVSDAANLPTEWDVRSGENIVWRAKVGSQTYAGPVIHGGRVYAGTNNEGLRRPGIEGDKGVLIALDKETGDLLWQATHDKLGAGRVNDWPLQGICSTPYVEDERVYYVSNRATVVAVDVDGFRDGVNDGMTDEQYRQELDADIVWEYDMIAELDVFPHNLAAGSPLVIGDLLFTVTGAGVDEGHINLPSPASPAFIALNKNTGELVWESLDSSDAVLHGSWSNPGYGVVDGQPQIAFPGGDGWLYTYEPATGNLLWKFDLNPKDSIWELGGAGTRNNIISTPVFYNNRFYLGVGQDPEHGEGPGHFYAMDANVEGDATGSAAVWHFGNEDFNRTISTAAISDGLLYIPDLSGFLYVLDVETGEHLWTHDTFAAVWGSAFVADGKVYLGDEDGDIVVLEAGREEKVIAEHNMGSAVYTTPVAEDGRIYVATRSDVFAIGSD